MNYFTIISFLFAIGVLLGGFYLTSPNLGLFLDYPSLFIVMGGTIAATAISFKLDRMFILTKIFVMRVLTGKTVNLTKHVAELIEVIDQNKKGKSFSEVISQVNDFFLIESLELIQDGLLSKNEILELLELRNNKLVTMYKIEGSKMKAIAKFPPAFGMIGTTIGMIVLLANLGGEDAMKMIGPAMGVCLITTLYGASIANIFLIPMSENLNDNTKEIYARNQITIEGAKLILEKANPVLAAERLNSFLSPNERVDWKEIIGKS